MKHAPLALALLGLTGCFAPTSGTQKLADSAYDMNNATAETRSKFMTKVQVTMERF